MNDARAYQKMIGLHKWLDELDNEHFCSSDNAYPLSDKVLIPFSGASRYEGYNLVYHY